MQLHIGDTAPNFMALTTQGWIDFHQWMGSSWALFFSHPADFTPVCTTELGTTSRLLDELTTRNVKALGLSTDSVESHLAWIDDINDTQHTDFFVPLVADQEGQVAQLYDMIHPKESGSSAVRKLYIIDSSKTIRMSMSYPINVGRNFCEVLRVIDALRLSDQLPVVTPADWQTGEPVIISPSVSNRIAARLFSQGWDEVRPYLRYVSLDCY